MAKKILIVDDEGEMRDVLRVRLEGNDYQVIEASDGVEGLSVAQEIQPDLIILDVMMPKMDGFNVCRMLKFDEQCKNIPIILLTAKAESSDKETAQDVKAEAYITKPYKAEELIAQIHTLLKDQ